MASSEFDSRHWDSPKDKENSRVDKLALFLDRIAQDTSVSAETPEKWKTRAVRAMEKTSKWLFEHERRAQQIFEKQPASLTARGGHVTQKGRNHFQLRYYLKRFTNPDATEVVNGVDLPPGAILHRLNPHLSAEQRRMLKTSWSPCVDDRGVISPAKIFSWLAPAITSAVEYLSKKDSEKDPNDIPADEPDFRDVQLIVKFPLIRIVFPPARPEPDEESEYDFHSTTIHSESTAISLLSSGTTTYRSLASLAKSSIHEPSIGELPEPIVAPLEASPPKADYGYVNTQLTFWTADSQYIVKSPQVILPPKEPCGESNTTSVWPETDDDRDRRNNNKQVEYDEYGLPIEDTDPSGIENGPGLSLDDLKRNGHHIADRNSDISRHESLESQSLDLSSNNDDELPLETNEDTLEFVTDVTETNTYFTNETNRTSCLHSETPTTSKITSRSGLFSAKTATIMEERKKKRPKTYKPELPELPLIIDIVPSVRGYGWPKGVSLHLGLPKQKPFCEKGQKCVAKMHKKIDDGYSLWNMDLLNISDNPNSPVFKDVVAKFGNMNRLWTCSLAPAENVILKNVKKICMESETDLEPVFKVLQIIVNHQNWDIFSPEILNSVIQKVVRKTLVSKPDLKELCLASLHVLHQVASMQKCPSILQANINIASGIAQSEGKKVAEEINYLLKRLKREPGYILRYIGFPTKEEKRQKEMGMK